jgi:hypothetical protein
VEKEAFKGKHRQTGKLFRDPTSTFFHRNVMLLSEKLNSLKNIRFSA